LHGAVGSVEEREMIEAVVQAVPGVRGVVNKVGVA
jgi:osmotically-inducible protein OsmY